MRNDIRQIMITTFQFWTRAKSFDILEIRQVIIAVLLISLARTITTSVFYLQKVNFRLSLLEFMLWTIYVISACIFIAFLLSRLVAGIEFKQALNAATCLYWVVPLVPFFSHWDDSWGLGFHATIPFFKWFPTFLVEHNYLPLGMVVAGPFLLWQTYRFIVHSEQSPKPRAIIITLLVFTSVYVVYYQWIWAAFIVVFSNNNITGYQAVMAQFFTYEFLCQVITFLLTPTVVRAFGGRHLALYTACSGVLLAFLFFVPKVGFLAAFLVPRHP